MWRLADRQIDEFVARGECEFIERVREPVHPARHRRPARRARSGPRVVPRGAAGRRPAHGAERGEMAHKPLEFLYERFTHYIEDRRREPRNDVMTELATATFPDGTLPEVNDVMLIASNLFAAGGETTARLLGTMLRYIGGPPRAAAAAARRASAHPRVRRGDAAARDPAARAVPVGARPGDGRRRRPARRHHRDGAQRRREPRPAAVRGPGRAPPRPGERPPAPRVRVRHPHVRRRTARPRPRRASASSASSTAWPTSRISEAAHGPAGARRYEYSPIYLLRGLEQLQLEFTPIGGGRP